MNEATQVIDQSKAESPQAHPASPLPTPAVSEATPQQSAALMTRSFDPIATPPTLKTDTDERSIPLVGNLEGYVIVEPIGRGGMGVVYKALQPNTEQIVALKVIRDGLLADEASQDRFQQEVRAMGRLQSAKNIVPIYHVGQYRGSFFYVMPFLAGGSLSRQRERFRGDRVRVVTLLEKMARAVHQLHLNDILHRDIKPGNILLDADDEPYLSDFGLAKLLDQDESLTASNQRLGTPAYMAPEQTGLLNTPMSPQTDIWALGVVLYELLTGTRPFLSAESEVSTTLLWKIVNEAPPQPRKLQPDFDPGLEAVILKCLEKSPADRFASAEALADELHRWLQGEALNTPTYSLKNRVRRAVRRHPIWTGVLAAVVLTLSIGIPVVFRPRDPELPVQRLEDALAAGRPVTLIAETGQPAWFDILHGDDAETSTDKAGYFIVKSNKRTLVRLLRETPTQAYRLRVKIRDDGSQLNGRIGVFWGHHAKKTNFGTFEYYHQAIFNDFIDNNSLFKPENARPVKNAFQMNAVLYAAEVGKYEPRHLLGNSRGISFEATRFKGGKWRDLEITVQPNQMRIQFDQKEPVALLDMDDEVQRMRKDFDRRVEPDYAVLKKLEAQFHPRGGLGILVDHSTAAFSNFIVEPMATER